MGSELIELQQVCRYYRMGSEIVRAVDEVSLTIKQGEYVALTGPSGSGKSTLMNILGFLDMPTSGHYFFRGMDVTHMTDIELSALRNREVGFVFQMFHLLPRYTALENVMLPLIYAGVPKHKRIERAKEVLERVGLADRIHHKQSELSGGQCQRVAIARALVNNPSLILADEPTGNLDTKMSDEIMNLFEAIHKEGNTIVLVTHDPDIARRAQRIISIKDGKIDNEYKSGI